MKKPRTVRMAGLDVPVIAAADVPGDAVLACIARTVPLRFPENKVGFCADCPTAIQWHPSSPTGFKRVCNPCAVRRAKEDGNAEFRVTEEQVAFIQRQGKH